MPDHQLAVDLQDQQGRSATEAPTHSNDLDDLQSCSATKAPTHSNDPEYIKNLLAKINNIDLTQLKVKRLHSENNKGDPSPVLMRLQSSVEVIRVIRNRKLLLKNINIFSGKTPAQPAQLRSIVKKVTDYNQAHPNEPKMIKYINN